MDIETRNAFHGDIRDAMRMRALCACPIIEMHGSAGIHAGEGRRLYPEEPGMVHFGANFMGRDVSEAVTQWGRFSLALIAEDRIAFEGEAPPSTPVGASIAADAERFRALMRLPRIRVISCDMDPDLRGDDPHRSRPLRFAAEFWPTPPRTATTQCEPTAGRTCLVILADDLVDAARATETGPH